jgi:hypothetical protein
LASTVGVVSSPLCFCSDFRSDYRNKPSNLDSGKCSERSLDSAGMDSSCSARSYGSDSYSYSCSYSSTDSSYFSPSIKRVFYTDSKDGAGMSPVVDKIMSSSDMVSYIPTESMLSASSSSELYYTPCLPPYLSLCSEDCSSPLVNTTAQSITFSSLCELACHLLHSNTQKMMDFISGCDFISCVLSILFHPVHTLSLSVVRYGRCFVYIYVRVRVFVFLFRMSFVFFTLYGICFVYLCVCIFLFLVRICFIFFYIVLLSFYFFFSL